MIESNSAMVTIDDLFRDTQTQTVCLTYFFSGENGIENIFSNRFQNAGAIVSNGNLEMFFEFMRCKLFPLICVIFEGVERIIE